ncbi:EAL domain-containing protein [Conexibacter sp. JD483]|uniref:EAL domain-containing protein n=1 Tax=unclassified Conexibacter TaxID=2627773 RepID=UPI00272442E7|nr:MULTISPECIES: EAL domain-containing protein [unclassified Conexibacter]MDO8185922.1 EAL domain-containing protein [Conexibacter sp. CPCC 205706]MDO8199413.1 EAL domain-containing protein [Conexibacter sp. CPCC 205762]MDR9368532.1 EAL domain-containing protein [Conexibacter sp. JD483]
MDADREGTAPDESSDAVSVSHLIDRRGRCRLAYEPVADLARGVICGFEARARFPAAMSRDRWRREALERGLEPDFDAFVVGSVLAARESLPADCFLGFDIDPRTLVREAVQRVLAEAGRLDRLVIELTALGSAVEEPQLEEAARRLRDAGATIAVDGVGGGTATLRQIAIVRPEFVKLDPALVRGIHRDDAKLVIVDTIGHLASQLDAWIVAQGVSQVEELDALIALRAPLAQGPLIGVSTKTLTRIGFALSAYVRDRGAAATTPSALVALLERVAPLERDAGADERADRFSADAGLQHLPVVDARRRPVGMLGRAAALRGEDPLGDVLVVAPSGRIPELAQRAMLRPPEARFHPIVCCDVQGRYLGLVRVERLVAALAQARERTLSAV